MEVIDIGLREHLQHEDAKNWKLISMDTLPIQEKYI